jgi:hypothetical protein
MLISPFDRDYIIFKNVELFIENLYFHVRLFFFENINKVILVSQKVLKIEYKASNTYLFPVIGKILTFM